MSKLHAEDVSCVRHHAPCCLLKVRLLNVILRQSVQISSLRSFERWPGQQENDKKLTERCTEQRLLKTYQICNKLKANGYLTKFHLFKRGCNRTTLRRCFVLNLSEVCTDRFVLLQVVGAWS